MKYLLLLILLFLNNCSGGGDFAGGSSSETTTGIIAISSAGAVSGKVQSNSTVMLFSTDYNALTQNGYADTIKIINQEEFNFSSLESGFYNLFATDEITGEQLFIPSIKVMGNEDNLSYIEKFKNGGNVNGALKFEDKEMSDLTIALQGTPFSTKLSDSQFNFSNIPEGNYQIMYQSTPDTGWNETIDIVEIKEITIISDTTVEWTK